MHALVCLPTHSVPHLSGMDLSPNLNDLLEALKGQDLLDLSLRWKFFLRSSFHTNVYSSGSHSATPVGDWYLSCDRSERFSPDPSFLQQGLTFTFEALVSKAEALGVPMTPPQFPGWLWQIQGLPEPWILTAMQMPHIPRLALTPWLLIVQLLPEDGFKSERLWRCSLVSSALGVIITSTAVHPDFLIPWSPSSTDSVSTLQKTPLLSVPFSWNVTSHTRSSSQTGSHFAVVFAHVSLLYFCGAFLSLRFMSRSPNLRNSSFACYSQCWKSSLSRNLCYWVAWIPITVLHNTRQAETIPDVPAIKPSESSELNETLLSRDVNGMKSFHPKLVSNSSPNGVPNTASLF